MVPDMTTGEAEAYRRGCADTKARAVELAGRLARMEATATGSSPQWQAGVAALEAAIRAMEPGE